jgi:hypothetical protein
MGMTVCAASIIEMLSGWLIVTTAVLAKVFLGRNQKVFHWLSIFAIIFGIFLVGLANISNRDNEKSKTTFLGVILILLSRTITAGQFVVEEKIFKEKKLDALYVVGIEGFWGCLLFLFILPIFQIVKCDDKDLCNNGKIEDSLGAIKAHLDNPVIMAQTIIVILLLAGLNGTGLAITKYASAA